MLPALLNGLDVREHDVVHFHGDDWFTLRRPRATVRTLYGTALREAQHATRASRRALQYLLFGAERLSHRWATVTVALGRDEAELHGIERVIGCGVDDTVFRPGVKSAQPRLLYVGSILTALGGMLYRFTPTTIAYRANHPSVYFPKIAELIMCVGYIGFAVVTFIWIAKQFAIIPAPVSDWYQYVKFEKQENPNLRINEHGAATDY